MLTNKVPRDKLCEAYKFFTTDPVLLDFHVDSLIQELGEEQESYEVDSIHKAMRDMDVQLYK